MIPQVIEVPSPLGLRPSGLEDPPDAVRIDVPPYDGVRDPETGILNPHGITAVPRDVASAVAGATRITRVLSGPALGRMLRSYLP